MLFGGRFFVSSSVSLSKLLKIPEIVVGATLVAVATTMPEVLVSVFASGTAHQALALGNILGSGMVNLGLLFGFILLIGRQQKQIEQGRRRRSLILFSVILFVFLTFLIFGKITFWLGIFLVITAFVYLLYTFWYAMCEAGENLVMIETTLENHLNVVFKFLIGALMIIIGARFLVESGVLVSAVLGIPEIVIGITMIAIGTSLPEITTASQAVIKGHERLSLGNLTGATILIFTLVLGLTSLVSEMKLPNSILVSDLLILLLFALAVTIYSFFPRIPQRIFGALMIFTYLFYLSSWFWLTR